MSKPTFLTLSPSLAFRNGEHKAKDWFATLNGCRVAACEANTERGYVDVIVFGQGMDEDEMLIHRLFGRIELRSVAASEWYGDLWATTDECNDCKDWR